MDLAYNQHADRFRRKDRSSGSLNHLSLAPLTVKLPLNDEDALPDPDPYYSHPFGGSTQALSGSTSYLQGKSAPTTPRLLSRSPAGPRSRSHHRTPSAPGGPITKSKSSSHLVVGADAPKSRSGAATPRRRKREDGLSMGGLGGDWMLRAGAMISTETREYKGQAWLVSRESSTSLAGMRDADDEAFENELWRERRVAASSRRGSTAVADDEASPYPSRFASRSNSIPGGALRSNVLTPHERPSVGDESYFPSDESLPGPDFVNLDEKLEELERDEIVQDDEAAVRRLVRRGQNGKGSWISNAIGWSLFSVEENEEDSDENSEDDEDDEVEDEVADDAMPQSGRSTWASRHFEGVSNAPEVRMPPPDKSEGGWNDASWLLSVATKVMF